MKEQQSILADSIKEIHTHTQMPDMLPVSRTRFSLHAVLNRTLRSTMASLCFASPLRSFPFQFPWSLWVLGTLHIYQLLCGLFYLKNLMTFLVDGIPQQLNHRHRSSLTHGQIS